MTRGRCGSLALHRTTLSFATPRRFNPAHRSHAMKEPIIVRLEDTEPVSFGPLSQYQLIIDRKSTRLNSSHLVISYAVFCLKKKNAQRDFQSRADRLELPRSNLPDDRPAH